ncbi:N-formylglutamate amidohydrolase [Novipirellula caenicola]|uniref:N-formylglutamate amidohydrolase n=1 Tax=Novipirellula caenicola TaxID=1536901 RepID=A0ABP9VUC9_9BACT
MTTTRFVVTSEHGGNEVPDRYASLFSSPGAKRDLHSHRGHDPGSLHAATQLSLMLESPLIFSTTTRLLVDLNRSLDHPHLFSKYTRSQPEAEKRAILDEYFHPYRKRVEDKIHTLLQTCDRVVHLSMHTFTPRFRGSRRAIDLGILYDPERSEENRFCHETVNHMTLLAPRRRIRHNEPYLGIDDGLTTYLRTQHPAHRYVGIEIEINNRYARWQEKQKQTLITQLARTLQNDSCDLQNSFCRPVDTRAK